MVERGFDNVFVLSGGLKVLAMKFPDGFNNGSFPIHVSQCVVLKKKNGKEYILMIIKFYTAVIQYGFEKKQKIFESFEKKQDFEKCENDEETKKRNEKRINSPFNMVHSTSSFHYS